MAEQKKKSHSHGGHRQRVKQKALTGGIEYWPIHEVLELLLMYSVPQKDVNPLAHDLLNKFGTFANVLDANYEDLKSIDGVGEGTALFLTLMPEFFAKYNASKNVDGVILDTTAKCVNYFKANYRVKNCEDFYILCLNAKRKLVKTFTFSSRLTSAVGVSLNEFSHNITGGAYKSIVIMHSHPSGDANPTVADVEATKRLVTRATMAGIKVDDHIILTDNEYFSFLQSPVLVKLLEQANQAEIEHFMHYDLYNNSIPIRKDSNE